MHNHRKYFSFTNSISPPAARGAQRTWNTDNTGHGTRTTLVQLWLYNLWQSAVYWRRPWCPDSQGLLAGSELRSRRRWYGFVPLAEFPMTR